MSYVIVCNFSQSSEHLQVWKLFGSIFRGLCFGVSQWTLLTANRSGNKILSAPCLILELTCRFLPLEKYLLFWFWCDNLIRYSLSPVSNRNKVRLSATKWLQSCNLLSCKAHEKYRSKWKSNYAQKKARVTLNGTKLLLLQKCIRALHTKIIPYGVRRIYGEL